MFMNLGDKVRTLDGIEGVIVARSGLDETAIVEFWVVTGDGRHRCTTGWRPWHSLTKL